MRTLVGIVAFCVVGAFLSACATVKTAGEDAKKTAEEIRKAGEELNQGMSRLSQIDPLALRSVLEDNKDLRAQLVQLNKLLRPNYPGGAIPIDPSNELYFRIKDYRGALMITAWIDEESNTFIQNAITPEKNPTLELNPRIVRDWMAKVGAATHPSPLGGGVALGPMGGDNLAPVLVQFGQRLWSERVAKDKEIVDSANAALVKYLSTRPVPTLSFKDVRIDTRLGRTRLAHRVGLTVVPMSVDSAGKWGLDFQFIARHLDGRESLVHFGSVSSDNPAFAGLQLKTPLTTDAGGFEVVLVDPKP